MSLRYEACQYLAFTRHAHGVLQITIDRPEKYNATNARLHWELSRIWPSIDEDPQVRVAVITGRGKAFSAGGDLDMVQDQAGDFSKIAPILQEASDIVLNITNMQKPLISAINGVAVGAGLAVALMADISVINAETRLSDGHIRLGVGAGDHAAILWPLLCGMAKAKYYLLTADFISGEEAERIGLVSLAVPADEVLSRALSIAERLAQGPQHAIRWTKRSLNHWIRQAGPIFDASLAFEMLNFFDADVKEGATALQEKREPRFPSAQG